MSSSFGDLTYNELREKCKALGLPATGKKAEMEARLEEHFAEQSGDEDVEELDSEEESSQDEEEEDDSGSDNVDEDDEDEDEDYEEGEQEVVGLLVRNVRGTGDDAEEELLLIDAEDLQEALMEASDDDDEDYDYDYDYDDGEDEDTTDDLFTLPDAKSPLVLKAAVALEITALFLLAVAQNYEATKDDAKSTVSEQFLHALVAAFSTFALAKFMVFHFVIFVCLPTFFGLLFNRSHESTDYVFGFTVARIALWFLLAGTLAVSGYDWEAIGAGYFLKMFHLCNVIPLSIAWWEKDVIF